MMRLPVVVVSSTKFKLKRSLRAMAAAKSRMHVTSRAHDVRRFKQMPFRILFFSPRSLSTVVGVTQSHHVHVHHVRLIRQHSLLKS